MATFSETVTGMAMSVVTSVYAKMWGEVRCSSAGSSSRAAEPHARQHRCVCFFPDAGPLASNGAGCP